MSIVLGFESSCDETGVAVVKDGRRVLANEIASQIDIHKVFGGVVPEIASRQHTRVISQLTRQALDAAATPVEAIDAIAATQGPGLMGSLLVGLSFAKALAFSWNKPFVPVHHIEGHLFSAFLGERAPEFPFLALIVSGGHTQIVQCDRPHHYEILGATRDDAVGESFDKVARLLDLPYPGGPSIQDAAKNGDPAAYDFPRSMRSKGNLEFSYSGLKTAVLYALKEGGDGINIADVAASFQAAAIDILIIKTRQAIAQTGAKRLVIAGGVAANRLLRERAQSGLGIEVFLPPFEYCIDNGAMIAAAADSLLQHGRTSDFTVTPNPSLALCP
ncbi:MAG: tRNA (adenosine(37)-N6)-threonylcarbamoyltransferase complex transferase subunit TsaD [Candidatus Hydrogenedentes bacterium]|nr:tRNA (adenosine(37)-N6)-threonylcarbamoyltransferase complex transferase subunit TsaD [Candidatus Hydrogenedentota bacterium]